MRFKLLAAAAVCIILLGCSSTVIKDDVVGPSMTTTTTTAPDGTVIVTEKRVAATVKRKSSSRGLFHKPPAPQHGDIDLGLDDLKVGGAGGNWSTGGGFGVFFWIGLPIALLGVALIVFLKMPSLGIPLVIIGGAVVAVGFLMATFPVVMLVIILLMLGLGVIMVWKGGYFAKIKKAFTQTVKGVQAAKDGKTEAEKDAMNAALAGEQDKSTRDLVADAKA